MRCQAVKHRDTVLDTENKKSNMGRRGKEIPRMMVKRDDLMI